MSEIIPQVTNNTEGLLVVRAGFNEDYKLEGDDSSFAAARKQKRLETLEKLNEQPGIVAETQGDRFQLMVNLEENLYEHFRDDSGGDAGVGDFLSVLEELLPYHPMDNVDRVMGIDWISPLGAAGVVNEHFQRWLNAGGFTEEVAKETARALAMPFGKSAVQKVTKQFRYSQQAGYQKASGYTSTIIVRTGKFGITLVDESSDTPTYAIGEVNWSSVDISTLGDCACWVVAGEDRSRTTLEANNKRLYEMHPHNVGFSRQSLGLLLGIATMAHDAASYPGREDILRDALLTSEQN